MLYCWECDHASPPQGDWHLEYHDSSVAYVCPECQTTITERPHRSGPPPTPPERASAMATAWRRVISATTRLWRVSVTAGRQSRTNAHE